MVSSRTSSKSMTPRSRLTLSYSAKTLATVGGVARRRPARPSSRRRRSPRAPPVAFAHSISLARSRSSAALGVQAQPAAPPRRPAGSSSRAPAAAARRPPRPEVLQLPQRGGVECPRLHPRRPSAAQPAHLPGRPRGESDGQHLGGVVAAAPDAVRDPVGDRPRLARPGAGEDADRTVERLGHRALLGVQCVQQRVGTPDERLGGGVGRGGRHPSILAPATDAVVPNTATVGKNRIGSAVDDLWNHPDAEPERGGNHTRREPVPDPRKSEPSP